MQSNWRDRILGGLAGWACDHPVAVLLFCLITSAASIFWTVQNLRFEPDRNALVSEHLPWHKRYLDYLKQFEGYDVIVGVVAVPDSPDGEARARALIDAWAEDLQGKSPFISRLIWKIDSRNGNPRLLRLQNLASFEAEIRSAQQAAPLLQMKNFSQLLGAVTAGMRNDTTDRSEKQAAAGLDRVTFLIRAIDSTLRGERRDEWLEAFETGHQPPWEYLASDDGRLLFLQIESRPDAGSLDPYESIIRAAEESLAAARKRHSGVEAGLTGIPVLESLESSAAMTDSTLCSILSVSLIALLLLVFMRSIRLPVLAVISLGTGIAWTFGFLTLAVGHLQMLSLFFTAILMGLGIDFSIHLLSRHRLSSGNFCDDPASFRTAMTDSFRVTGPGILTGAVTTSLSFGTTLLTDFKGMSEMGLIAAVGILLCLLSTFLMLPALMKLTGSPKQEPGRPTASSGSLMLNSLLRPLLKKPVRILIPAALTLAAAAAAVPLTRFDNNLLNLYPPELAAVDWQERIQTHSSRAIWYGVSLCTDLDQAARRARLFEAMPSVAGVGGAALLRSADAPEKAAILADLRDQLTPVLSAPLSVEPDSIPAITQRLGSMRLLAEAGLQRQEVRSSPLLLQKMTALRDTLQQTLQPLREDPTQSGFSGRLSVLQSQFSDWLQNGRNRLDRLTSPQPLQLEDLPEFLRADAADPDGKTYQLKIFPKEDVWNPPAMDRFIADLRRVDADLLGSPVQIHQSGLLMKTSYQQAGLYAFLAVLILVWLDFRKLSDALLSMLPVLFGFVIMFAVMRLIDMPINPANLIVLPMIFGIGVDAGVHILHRYRMAPHARPLGLTGGTAQGILLTGLTTIIGFGTLMLASHRGIQSLGSAMAVGIAATLVACLILMPVVLQARNRFAAFRHKAAHQQAASSTGRT